MVKESRPRRNTCGQPVLTFIAHDSTSTLLAGTKEDMKLLLHVASFLPFPKSLTSLIKSQSLVTSFLCHLFYVC